MCAPAHARISRSPLTSNDTISGTHTTPRPAAGSRAGPAKVIAATADRGAEKRALVGAGAPVVPHREATSPSELVAALEALDGPVICKTAGSVGRRSPCLSASGTRRRRGQSWTRAVSHSRDDDGS